LETSAFLKSWKSGSWRNDEKSIDDSIPWCLPSLSFAASCGGSQQQSKFVDQLPSGAIAKSLNGCSLLLRLLQRMLTMNSACRSVCHFKQRLMSGLFLLARAVEASLVFSVVSATCRHLVPDGRCCCEAVAKTIKSDHDP
jgi:hypothetical protein